MSDRAERFFARRARQPCKQPIAAPPEAPSLLPAPENHRIAASLAGVSNSCNPSPPSDVEIMARARSVRQTAAVAFDAERRNHLKRGFHDQVTAAITGALGMGYVAPALRAATRPPQSFHYWPGDPACRTAIILAAAGEVELRRGRPAAGQTGRNLKLWLSQMHSRYPEDFPSTDPDFYTYVNSVNWVMSKSREDRRTVPDEQEVRHPDQAARVRSEAGHATVIATFGDAARTAGEALGDEVTRYHTGHPSMTNLNSRMTNEAAFEHATPDERRAIEDAPSKKAAGHERAKVRARIHMEATTRIERVSPGLIDHIHQSAGHIGTTMVDSAARQMIGSVLAAFSIAAYEELEDCWRNGIVVGASGYIGSITARLRRAVASTTAEWKRHVEAGLLGVVSGLLTGVAEAILDYFKRLNRQLSRILREGIGSLVRASRLVVFPPAGMSSRQTWHEATKLLAVGMVTIGGIAVDELVAEALPHLAWLTQPILAIVTGCLAAGTAYALDRLDLLGVALDARQDALFAEIDRRLASQG